jgi:hypothetical protein
METTRPNVQKIARHGHLPHNLVAAAKHTVFDNLFAKVFRFERCCGPASNGPVNRSAKGRAVITNVPQHSPGTCTNQSGTKRFLIYLLLRARQRLAGR